MSDCSACPSLKDNLCYARPGHRGEPTGSDIVLMRRCVNTVLDRIAPRMTGNILEVGCGKCRSLRRRLPKNSIWTGVDPRWDSDCPRKREWNDSVDKMRFETNLFDVVYCSQVLEHLEETRWSGKSTPLEAAVMEMYRVLVPGGVMFVDFPMRSHGSELFKSGNSTEIRRIFSLPGWKRIQFEDWAYLPHPLKYQNDNEPMYLLAVEATK